MLISTEGVLCHQWRTDGPYHPASEREIASLCEDAPEYASALAGEPITGLPDIEGCGDYDGPSLPDGWQWIKTADLPDKYRRPLRLVIALMTSEYGDKLPVWLRLAMEWTDRTWPENAP